MRKIGLIMYSISIAGKNGKEVNLHNIENSEGLISLVEKFVVENNENYIDDNKSDSIFKFEKCMTEDIKEDNGSKIFSYIYGRLKTGEYGTESEIVDKNTGDIIHKVKSNQARVLPFDFMIALPAEGAKDVLTGLVILETKGSLGIKKIFEHRLKKYIKDINNNKIVVMNNIYPKNYIKRFFYEGVLKKIRLIKYGISKDDGEIFGVNSNIEKSRKEITISNPVGFIQRKKQAIMEFLDGKRIYSSIIEVPEFEYDDLKLEFSLGNTNKTLDMKNLEKIVLTEDITDKVDIIGGNPTEETMQEVMKENARLYLEEMLLIEKIE